VTTNSSPSRGPGGRVAFVTGGARGIGAAVARRLSDDGLAVAVGFRQDEAAATDVVRRIESCGGRAIPVRGDVSDDDEVDAAFDLVESELGAVDVLVNNAGIHRAGRITALSARHWRAVIDANLTGSFLCARRAVPKMVAAGYGCIVNISSVIGLNGFPGDAAYASAKAGLFGLTRALALELAGSGVRVNAVAPGFVDTEMTQALHEEVLQRIEASIPLRRQATTEEIADCVAFLASAGYVTGSVVVADGGWTITSGIQPRGPVKRDDGP
jgi:3-oxoacyl-[acyl-carrier protein] reductase